MNRTEIEIKLNRDRAWSLETFAGLTEEELNRGITVSKHNTGSHWSAKDHLSHLIGIEVVFNQIIRRSVEGDPNPIGFPSGTTMEEIMKQVHALNEAWVSKHHNKSFSEIVALGQQVRSETLALLASLTDAQLAEKIPGAPWADSTVGGVIAVNGDHARQHYGWVTAGLAGQKG